MGQTLNPAQQLFEKGEKKAMKKQRERTVKVKAEIVKKGKEYYLILPSEILGKLNCDTFDMQFDKEKKELRLIPMKSKKGKGSPIGKKKKTGTEDARLLADLRSGKVGFEDDSAEEAALKESFEKGEFKPISAARKKQLMKDTAKTLATAKKTADRFLMPYKGYLGRYRYDHEARTFHGEVVGITDVITFQAEKEKNIEKAFRDSIDDYLNACKRFGKKPCKMSKKTWLQNLTPASPDFMSKRCQPENQKRPNLDIDEETTDTKRNRQIKKYGKHLKKNKKSLNGFNKISEENWSE